MVSEKNSNMDKYMDIFKKIMKVKKGRAKVLWRFNDRGINSYDLKKVSINAKFFKILAKMQGEELKLFIAFIGHGLWYNKSGYRKDTSKFRFSIKASKIIEDDDNIYGGLSVDEKINFYLDRWEHELDLIKSLGSEGYYLNPLVFVSNGESHFINRIKRWLGITGVHYYLMLNNDANGVIEAYNNYEAERKEGIDSYEYEQSFFRKLERNISKGIN